ncbi:uncharacterized protein LOC106171266 [Lingula anatina]|uniref:Uncharacterized protein LOC106171266 n=1 Tax=Lingula anatina TaxID=7574 RepID=A0A1S3JAU0_LINAN|nr:uncharacterized protein LOC106171266 [Lingula anatina]|eukprot:XP_013406999.1 uncharacterized protein LOC106171266 [Lingula anatina]
MEAVYSKLTKKGTAVALSVSKDYAASFKPKTLEGDWPVDLKSVRNDSLRDASYEEILAHADSVNINVTPSQVSFVESVTREQAKSAKWCQYRVGRITASRIYEATRTNTETPSRSLIKGICKPTSFKSVHTDWGIRKEPVAKKAYNNEMNRQHTDFTMKDSGLVLHPDYPEFGASPDALVSCSCCGSGLLEVKCPSTLKDSDTIDMPYLKDKKLKRETKYFYQVQMQLFLTDRQYCDFFIWTPHATLCERITRDTKLWEDMCCKGQNFHRRVIMPELISSFFSRTATEADGHSYCVCGGGDDGRKMIACDGENCVTVWFHMTCLRIKRVTKGKWFCEKCS